MESVQSIDFTRGDVGWLLWLLIPLCLLVRLQKRDFVLGWRVAFGRIVWRVVLGLCASAFIMGLLTAALALTPPKFIRLELREDGVVLGYRWPRKPVFIPFKDVIAVGSSRKPRPGRRGRRGVFRIIIETAPKSYPSWEVGRLNDRELAVMDRLRARVGSTNATQVEMPEP